MKRLLIAALVTGVTVTVVVRVAWNLRPDPPAPGQPAAPLQHGGGRGTWVLPVAAGRYQAVLGKVVGDKVTPIGPARAFRVVAIPQ